jgi:hypothetical protein
LHVLLEGKVFGFRQLVRAMPSIGLLTGRTQWPAATALLFAAVASSAWAQTGRIWTLLSLGVSLAVGVCLLAFGLLVTLRAWDMPGRLSATARETAVLVAFRPAGLLGVTALLALLSGWIGVLAVPLLAFMPVLLAGAVSAAYKQLLVRPVDGHFTER